MKNKFWHLPNREQLNLIRLAASKFDLPEHIIEKDDSLATA